MSESEPKFEEEKPKKIRDARSFPELFEILEARGGEDY